MKLVSLFSGGKDSMYAIYLAQKQGHEVVCLLSVFAKSDESHLLHHPNLQWTKLQSESMNIPQLTASSDSEKTEDELSIISTLLLQAKEKFNIGGIVHGGIKSQFQKEKFESLCVELDLIALAPLWDTDPLQYMNELIDNYVNFIITTVTSDGLDDTWLGKLISKTDIKILKELSDKYKFNLNFEGGEAETFVLDCPLFSNPIIINQSKKIWDGYRGRFEIVDAGLDNNA